MYRNAFWRSVTELTVSSITPARDQPVPLLFPVVRVPELTTLTLLVELPAPDNAGLNWASEPTTLLSAEVAPMCGVLRAEALRTVRFVAQQSKGHWRASPEPGAIPKSALSDFVVRHIRPAVGPLALDFVFDEPRVYLVEDEEGTSAHPGSISWVDDTP